MLRYLFSLLLPSQLQQYMHRHPMAEVVSTIFLYGLRHLPFYCCTICFKSMLYPFQDVWGDDGTSVHLFCIFTIMIPIMFIGLHYLHLLARQQHFGFIRWAVQAAAAFKAPYSIFFDGSIISTASCFPIFVPSASTAASLFHNLLNDTWSICITLYMKTGRYLPSIRQSFLNTPAKIRHRQPLPPCTAFFTSAHQRI